MTDFYQKKYNLPAVRGQYLFDVELGKTMTWFRTGGKAEVVFKPYDLLDLQTFYREKTSYTPTYFLGAGSNTLVRDKGIKGVVIRMLSVFRSCEQISQNSIVVGAGCLDSFVADFCLARHIGGLEFLATIPGSIGGAIRMNAGCYGKETRNIVANVEYIDSFGATKTIAAQDIEFAYRHCGLPADCIVTKAELVGKHEEEQDVIKQRIIDFKERRNLSQPLHSKTCGSTFKNPANNSAWRLIDSAGCRGLRVGGAQISTQHCNFIINDSTATATDIETLGQEVQQKVLHHTGVNLEWEIKIIGEK